jgi:hypothetical protein
MMRLVLTCFAFAFCGVLVPAAAAEDAVDVPRSPYPLDALTCPDVLLRGCCNIYCSKPLPCIQPFCRSCCKDCYCDKPCPCIPVYCRGVSSYCYCCKPCPDLCRPIAADYFNCVERSAGCAHPHAIPNEQVPAVPLQAVNSASEGIDHDPPPPLLDHFN